MFMPGVWILWSEKKNFVIIFQKENGNTFTLFIIFILKSLQKEQNSTNLLLWPQSAGINLQSPQSDSTPWTLTLVQTLVKPKLDWLGGSYTDSCVLKNSSVLLYVIFKIRENIRYFVRICWNPYWTGNGNRCRLLISNYITNSFEFVETHESVRDPPSQYS